MVKVGITKVLREVVDEQITAIRPLLLRELLATKGIGISVRCVVLGKPRRIGMEGTGDKEEEEQSYSLHMLTL